MELTIGCLTRPYGTLLPFAEMCQHIAAAGYTDVGLGVGVVTSESTREQVLAVRQAALDAGVAPSMLLAGSKIAEGLEKAEEDYARLIDNTALVGARWILELGTNRHDLRADYIELMRRMSPRAEQAGVGITMKPHGGITLTAQDLLDIHGQVNHPAFGICYDPGNIIYYTKGEMRPETGLDAIAPLVTTGIIKDCKLENGEPDVMITPGEGLVDFRAVLAGLVQGGFRGPLYLECVGGKTVAEIDADIRRTLPFVRGILASL
ncbi:MAG: sugar phosphate isomerase/epimerase [Chloroflexi bacterium]|nr:sugar phosphate isomerase/epimerase [Chloroflexota bacterium]